MERGITPQENSINCHISHCIQWKTHLTNPPPPKKKSDLHKWRRVCVWVCKMETWIGTVSIWRPGDLYCPASSGLPCTDTLPVGNNSTSAGPSQDESSGLGVWTMLDDTKEEKNGVFLPKGRFAGCPESLDDWWLLVHLCRLPRKQSPHLQKDLRIDFKKSK